jgi:Metal-dependent hydrolases of the beta-lactamase superfamily III
MFPVPFESALLVRVAIAAAIAIGARPPVTSTGPGLRSHVILLGTGTPNADPARSGPAVAIVVDSNTYIVDAGPGIVRRAAAAKIAMPRLRIAFLTHLHSDHTVGLPDLMMSPWVLGRTVPLDVYGPPGTTAMVDHLQAAYAQDIDIRLHGGEPSNKTGYGGKGHDVLPGIVYKDSLVTVTAFEVPHGRWPHAYGYRFQTPDRTYRHLGRHVAERRRGQSVQRLRRPGARSHLVGIIDGPHGRMASVSSGVSHARD